MKILIPISGKSNRVILRQETLNEETNLMLPESQKKETFIGVVESTSEFTSDKFESAKEGLSDGFSAAKEKVSEGVGTVSEATAKAEPRVH